MGGWDPPRAYLILASLLAGGVVVLAVLGVAVWPWISVVVLATVIAALTCWWAWFECSRSAYCIACKARLRVKPWSF